MSNRQLEERQEESSGRSLAAELGITYEELLELDYEVAENASDDGLVYEYIVTFSEGSPSQILSKVKGLSNYKVSLSPSFFEDSEE